MPLKFLAIDEKYILESLILKFGVKINQISRQISAANIPGLIFNVLMLCID